MSVKASRIQQTERSQAQHFTLLARVICRPECRLGIEEIPAIDRQFIRNGKSRDCGRAMYRVCIELHGADRGDLTRMACNVSGSCGMV